MSGQEHQNKATENGPVFLCKNVIKSIGRHGGGERRFIDAVLWIACAGLPCRDLPQELGHWSRVDQRFAYGAPREVLSLFSSRPKA